MQPAFLRVKVHPGAKADCLEVLSDGGFEVWTRAKPIEGRATEAVAVLLSDHMGVPRSRLRLIRGGRGRNKLFELIGG